MRPIAVLLILLSSIAAAAQQQPASADDINRLVEVMHMKKQMTDMQHAILDQYKPMMEKMTADMAPTMTPQQRQKFNGIVSDTLSELLNAYPPDDAVKDMLPIYQKYLDSSDVEAMIGFYSTPTGQKLLDIQPKIIRDVMGVVMPKMQERVQAATQRMQDRIRALAAEDQSQPAKEKEFKPATPAPK
jgi:uncharacterized protein